MKFILPAAGNFIHLRAHGATPDSPSGEIVAEGEIIATMSGAPPQQSTISPHLHLSFAWIPGDRPRDQLNWENLNHDAAITLMDPLSCLVEPSMEEVS